METLAMDRPSSSCPCVMYSMDQIVEIVQAPNENDSSLQRLIDWIGGPNLACRKQRPTCRLTAARGILKAIRDSFPTVDEPTAAAAAASFSGATTTTTITSTPHSLSVTDTNAFPPLTRAASSSTDKNNNHKKPQQANFNAPITNNNKQALPPLRTTPKKGKRRIRPAIVSTSPLSTLSHKNDPVWGSSSQASNGGNGQSPSWPPQATKTTTTTTQQESNQLLESRLSSTVNGQDATTLSSVSTLTPTKKKPTAAVTLVVTTPTKPTDENHQSANTQFVDPVMVQETPPPAALCRLADLYISIVEAALVHSTPHEVLYVLRLLQGATTRPTWQHSGEQVVFTWLKNKEGKDVIGHTSSSDKYLRLISVQFVCRVLDKLCHRLLCWGLASHLADCPPIQQFCPQVHARVQEYLGRIEHHRSIPRNSTAFWTLPFDEMRDSRNRYRTQDEMVLYKNREETRDAFLSHLRAFYNQGSSVLQTASSKSADQVRKAARWVLDPLMDDNVPWLAELFTDMLLQLGSVPVQETDREVLKMADQEKVQKLHQRFKTPARKGGGSGGRNKKTIPVVEEGSRTTAVQEEFFRGHQEFFYYFIMLADSHKLSFHLRHQFLEKIYQISSGLSSSNLDRNLDDLCLLGRFLGVLVFSPNWHSSKKSLDESRSRSLVYDELDLLRFGGRGILSLLRECYGQRRLISVVPWLVALLRMSVWYEAFRRTKSFRNVALELRGLQLLLSTASQQQASDDCRELLLLYFESFADEIAGLDWMEDISVEGIANDSIEAIVADAGEGLDTECRTFEIGTIFAANSRTENVLNMVTDMAKSSRGVTKSPGASRKVRPSIVVSASSEKPPEYQSSDLKSDGDNRLQKELRASFFHLHRDLQEICDFSVNRVMNTLFQLWKEVNVDEFLIVLSGECVDWIATQDVLRKQYTSRMKAELEKCVKRSLQLFAPDCDDAVRRIATELSVDRGMQAGQTRVDAKLLEAVTTAKADFEKAKKLKVTQTPAVEKDRSRVSLIARNLSLVNELIGKNMHEIETTHEDLLEAMTRAEDSLESWIAMETPENPPEKDLRSLYCSVAALDTSFSSLLASLANTEIATTNAWLILDKVFRIAAQSCHLCSYGFQSVKRALSSLEYVSWLISSGARCSDARRVKDLVDELCRARLIPIRLRKEALREVGIIPLNNRILKT